MAFLMGIFGQTSGNGLGYFNVSVTAEMRRSPLAFSSLLTLGTLQLSIYQALGFDKKMQFNMNLIGTCCSAAVAWTSVSLQDRMPRRRVLVWGTLGCSFMLAANAAFSAAWASYEKGNQNLDVGRAGAAFFCEFFSDHCLK